MGGGGGGGGYDDFCFIPLNTICGYSRIITQLLYYQTCYFFRFFKFFRLLDIVSRISIRFLYYYYYYYYYYHHYYYYYYYYYYYLIFYIALNIFNYCT